MLVKTLFASEGHERVWSEKYCFLRRKVYTYYFLNDDAEANKYRALYLEPFTKIDTF